MRHRCLLRADAALKKKVFIIVRNMLSSPTHISANKVLA